PRDFASIDDLLNVPGIGEKILEGIRPYVTVGSAAVSQNEVTTAERTAAEPVQSGKVNINTATAEQLTALDGIGESKANAIIQYREQHGDFKSPDDLLNVKGIGEKTLSNIRQDITL
ncbi:MAG: helix-hairpin-helix domain-containing protein, partial [Oscillospiraceae bacterium]|nr:helix-hairpin-helix domain-containing protein [Oscillospiraceae bacterium]